MTQDDDLTNQVSATVQLASDVATQARRQWAEYKDHMVKMAGEVQDAASKFGGPNADERAVMEASARVAASLADVLVNFADAAFEATFSTSGDTRSNAAKLIQKVVKVAVDDTLDGSTRTAQRTTRLLEIHAGHAWETIYLPTRPGGEVEVHLELSGLQSNATIQVRTNRNDSVELRNKDRKPIPLKGSRPSLSIRMHPDKPVATPASALLQVHDATPLSVGLLLLPPAPPPGAKGSSGARR